MNLKIFLIIANLSLTAPFALAQEKPPARPAPLQDKPAATQDIIDIEQLYKENNPAPVAPKPVPAAKSETPAVTEQEKKEIQEIQNNTEVQNSRMKSVADLNKLSPFSDVSVIQRKYLPKTGRYQFFAAAGLTTNSPWFLNLGFKANLGYNFNESFGVELSGMFLTSSEKEVAKEIRENNSLQPEKFVLTKYNLGIDLVWSPIYGKLTTLDNTIIPFDMYFSAGGGTSGTNSKEKTVPTIHVGTGQIFALSKSSALRWDYGWYYYQATPTQDSASAIAPLKGEYSDLIFTAGISFFFPEANYR